MNSPNGYNIIDVVKGIHALGLYSHIKPASFTFFIGLICKANELGFKEEISLTTSQAMSLGGGNSRQSVHQHRAVLCKFKVDGQPILEVRRGNLTQNHAAKYKINYEILQKYGSSWKPTTQASETIPSNYIDTSLDTSLDETLTIHREEDSIEDNKKSEASEHFVDNLPIEEDAREPNIYLTVRRKILIKYPEMKLTDGDVGKIIAISKEPFYEGGKIDYWYNIIDRMPEWDKLEIQNVHGILAYGKRAWPDYKKAHKIQAFFGR